MAQLVISGAYDLMHNIKRHRPDLVVSLTDPSPDDIGRARRELMLYEGPVVKLAFHDIDWLIQGCVAPNPSHLRAVARALDQHLPSGKGTVLVHCAAGVSRSPAIGLFVLGYLSKNRAAPYEVFDRWKAAAGDCEPNRRILMMLGSELGAMGRELAEKAIKDVQENKLAARKGGAGAIF